MNTNILPITTPGGYVIDKPIDIILITCNRLQITRETIDQLHKRLQTPFRLIVVDDMSIDGTAEYLEDQHKMGRIDVLAQLDNSNICQAYNKGYEFVESEYFITMQDDITVPKLETCVVQQLIDLMEKYPEQGGIGCRIQRIPNMDWQNGDLSPARKALSAYFRIQRKQDFVGDEYPFGNRQWDDMAFVQIMRGEKGKECSWANNLWADHSRGYCEDRGYLVKPRKWGTGIHSRTRQAHLEKPYPIIDPETCIPLEIINRNKFVVRRYNADQRFGPFKMRTRLRFHDEAVLLAETVKDCYRMPAEMKVMIDVGAHIGGSALVAASRGATVYAFEPELSNYETLKYNVRRNRLHDKIHCFNCGIGPAGSHPLFTHPNNSGAVSAFTFARGIDESNYEIAVFIPLEKVFEDYQIEYCDLLKLDCEGGEDYIIRNLTPELAAKIGQISLEFHEKPKIPELLEILSQYYNCTNTHRYEWVCTKKL